MNIVAIIPARYGSTRFPGKALATIKGKPMIQWVCEGVRTSAHVGRVIVATDDARIRDAVCSFGGEAIMTSTDHETGTDRIAEVASSLSCDIIVNVQGDEPLIRAQMIDCAVKPLLDDPALSLSTICTKITDASEITDPNVVKVVRDRNGFALYFSRAPIPWVRNGWTGGPCSAATGGAIVHYKHIGLYVYRRTFLLAFANMPPTTLESLEKLEQLRALENSHPIKVMETEYESFGVDIPDDLSKIEARLA